jgi:hypothetical protein
MPTLKPNIQKDVNPSQRGPTAGPPVRIIDNPPQATVAAALASGKRQVEASK